MSPNMPRKAIRQIQSPFYMSREEKSEFSKIQKAAENLVENRTFERKDKSREPKEAHFQSTLEESEPFACPRFLEIESIILKILIFLDYFQEKKDTLANLLLVDSPLITLDELYQLQKF